MTGSMPRYNATDGAERSGYRKEPSRATPSVCSYSMRSVLEQVMRNVKAKWGRKKYGIQLGHIPATVLYNLCFTDGILLLGGTLPQIKQMIVDVAAEGARVGLT